MLSIEQAIQQEARVAVQRAGPIFSRPGRQGPRGPEGVTSGLVNLLQKGAVGGNAALDTAALQSALADAIALGCGIEAPVTGAGPYTFSADITIPDGVPLVVHPGAQLAPQAGVTLVLNGGVRAGSYRVFGGAGVVHIGGAPCHVNAKWFGCALDGATDDTAALGRALDAVRAAAATRGATVYIPRGELILNPDAGLLYITTGMRLVGDGRAATRLKRKPTAASVDGGLYLGDNAVTHYDIELADIGFDGSRANEADAGAGVVLFAKNVTRLRYRSIEILGGQHFGHNAILCKEVQAQDVFSHDHNRDAFSWGDGCENITLANIETRDCGDDGLAFNSETTTVKNISVAGFTCIRGGMNTSGGGAGGAALKISGDVRGVAVAGIVARDSAGPAVSIILGFNGIGSPSDVVVSGLESIGAGALVGLPNRQAVLVSGGAKRVRISGRASAGAADGWLVDAGCEDVTIDLDVDGMAGVGGKIDGSGARPKSVKVRGAARNCAASGLLATKVDGLSLVGFVATDNNTAGNGGDPQSCGANIQDSTNVTVAGGRFSQDAAGAANKQRYGLLFSGAACTNVTVAGVESVGNTVAGVAFQTAPAGQFALAGVSGASWYAGRLLAVNNGTVMVLCTNSPEGAIGAPVGSLALRENGASSAALYVKVQANIAGDVTKGWEAAQTTQALPTIDGWQTTNVPANSAAAAMPRTPLKYTVASPMSLTALVVKDLTGATAGGTCTVTVYVNNVATALSAVIAVGASLAVARLARGALQVNAGDVITMGLTTPAGWTSTTHTVTATLEYAAY